jgi:hypothetical protein
MSETCNICWKKSETVWLTSDSLFKKVVANEIDYHKTICQECFERAAREKKISLYWECKENEYPSSAPMENSNLLKNRLQRCRSALMNIALLSEDGSYTHSYTKEARLNSIYKKTVDTLLEVFGFDWE